MGRRGVVERDTREGNKEPIQSYITSRTQLSLRHGTSRLGSALALTSPARPALPWSGVGPHVYACMCVWMARPALLCSAHRDVADLTDHHYD